MNADIEVMEHFPERLDRAASDRLAARIRAHWGEHGFGLFAVEVPGEVEFAGYVGLSVPGFEAHFTPCVEVGWRLARAQWGKRYATEAACACLRLGFEELALPQIVSMTVPSNARSWRVMEKIGMTRDENGDFDHPRIPVGSPLRRHVLYRLLAPVR